MPFAFQTSSRFPPLACTVRDCFRPLTQVERSLVCPLGHSYDIARSGYVNLLQPQDRKSAEPGDSHAAVAARAALLAAGIGRAVMNAVVARASALLENAADPVVVELGSGSGELIRSVTEATGACAVGIDLSTAAAIHAARRCPSATWVVANADRRLPLLDASVDLVLSIHARRNPTECRRILVPGGHLLVAVPAADDLIELREEVQGEAVLRDRVDALIAEHSNEFTVVERLRSHERLELDREQLVQLLRGTYRGERFSASPRVEALGQLPVTLASDIVLFRA